MTISQMLEEFHQKFAPFDGDEFEDQGKRALRQDLLLEEFTEYLDAESINDKVGIADALADMIYVIFGTAAAYDIPLDEVIAEVHRSNMTKLGRDGVALRRADGKVLKGPNYEPPRIGEILSAHRRRGG